MSDKQWKEIGNVLIEAAIDVTVKILKKWLKS